MENSKDINTERKETINPLSKKSKKKCCPCTPYQLLAIIIPFSILGLFTLIFLSVFLIKCKGKPNNDEIEEFDNFTEFKANLSYATLTPRDGYDKIYIHLGGITEIAGYFSKFFKSNTTFIPKGTKIYYLSGKLRKTKYVEEKFFNIPIPSWFNVDTSGNLICEECSDQYDQAKESLYYILDKIEQIKNEENIDYNKIYLGGFSQGGIMVNYVLLNSRYKLGGYLAFSGYVFDHHFPPNTVLTELNEEQKQILESKKDYHILATHSFNDDSVFYPKIIEAYYTYYKDYSDFTLLSFGKLGHEFDTQPIHPYVRKWLKESMGKLIENNN